MTPLSLPTRALIFATKAHGDQKRKYTSDPYIVHPIAVADRVKWALATEGADPWIVNRAVAAAYLHDVVEDTDTGFGTLGLEFGNYVMELVLQVTDVAHPEDGNRAARKEMDRQWLAQSSPIGATIKLADLIDNTSTILDHDPYFAKVYMKEKALLLPLLKHGNDYLWKEASGLVANYYGKTWEEVSASP